MLTNKFTVPRLRPRNPCALGAKMRRAGYMKDRRAVRGGARDDQAEIMSEMDLYDGEPAEQYTDDEEGY